MRNEEPAIGPVPPHRDEDLLLLLARELEWVEAYLTGHPVCMMAWYYRDLLESELAEN